MYLDFWFMVNNLPSELAGAIRRAGAIGSIDDVNCTMHIKSTNDEAPLTDLEKMRIRNWCGMCGYGYRIVFDN